MATIERFEDLDIWKEARLLSKEIIQLSKNTELKTDYKLRDQIKNASGSVIANFIIYLNKNEFKGNKFK